MGKASKATTPTTMDMEMAEDRTRAARRLHRQLRDDPSDHDLAPMLASLPGGMCQCPHWGVMTKGRMTVTYADRKEVFEAGDAFYMPPGHTPEAEAGSEFIQFSPTDLLAETEAAIAASDAGVPSEHDSRSASARVAHVGVDLVLLDAIGDDRAIHRARLRQRGQHRHLHVGGVGLEVAT